MSSEFLTTKLLFLFHTTLSQPNLHFYSFFFLLGMYALKIFSRLIKMVIETKAVTGWPIPPTMD